MMKPNSPLPIMMQQVSKGAEQVVQKVSAKSQQVVQRMTQQQSTPTQAAGIGGDNGGSPKTAATSTPSTFSSSSSSEEEDKAFATPTDTPTTDDMDTAVRAVTSSPTKMSPEQHRPSVVVRNEEDSGGVPQPLSPSEEVANGNNGNNGNGNAEEEEKAKDTDILPPLEEDPQLALMQIVLDRTLDHVSVQEWYQVCWLEQSQSQKTTTTNPSSASSSCAFFGPWLSSSGKREVRVGDWEFAAAADPTTTTTTTTTTEPPQLEKAVEKNQVPTTASSSDSTTSSAAAASPPPTTTTAAPSLSSKALFVGDWDQQEYTQRRTVTFYSETNQSALVTHTQYGRWEDDDDDSSNNNIIGNHHRHHRRYVVAITVRMKNIPFADTFNVQIRWVATQITMQSWTTTLRLQVGVFVNFHTNVWVAGQIRSRSLQQTTKAQTSLYEAMEKELDRYRRCHKPQQQEPQQEPVNNPNKNEKDDDSDKADADPLLAIEEYSSTTRNVVPPQPPPASLGLVLDWWTQLVRGVSLMLIAWGWNPPRHHSDDDDDDEGGGWMGPESIDDCCDDQGPPSPLDSLQMQLTQLQELIDSIHDLALPTPHTNHNHHCNHSNHRCCVAFCETAQDILNVILVAVILGQVLPDDYDEENEATPQDPFLGLTSAAKKVGDILNPKKAVDKLLVKQQREQHESNHNNKKKKNKDPLAPIFQAMEKATDPFACLFQEVTGKATKEAETSKSKSTVAATATALSDSQQQQQQHRPDSSSSSSRLKSSSGTSRRQKEAASASAAVSLRPSTSSSSSSSPNLNAPSWWDNTCVLLFWPSPFASSTSTSSTNPLEKEETAALSLRQAPPQQRWVDTQPPELRKHLRRLSSKRAALQILLQDRDFDEIIDKEEEDDDDDERRMLGEDAAVGEGEKEPEPVSLSTESTDAMTTATQPTLTVMSHYVHRVSQSLNQIVEWHRDNIAIIPEEEDEQEEDEDDEEARCLLD